jgi:hypothetical protein
MYTIDDARAPLWDTAQQKIIDKINENNLRSKASGSRAVRTGRSFG